MSGRFSIPIGVHLVLIQNSEIALMQRSNTGYSDGLWSLPAGAIDGNEMLSEAMIREAREELGIMIEAKDLIFDGMMHKIESDNYENIAVFFICQQWQGEVVNQEPHKCAAVQFFSSHHLPDNCAPYVAHYLENLQKKNYLEWR
jgi:8-oxo-dGTP diphosphatase